MKNISNKKSWENSLSTYEVSENQWKIWDEARKEGFVEMTLEEFKQRK